MIVTSYPFLDASSEEYQEEEVYFQEEEDHFDQYTNQGKLIFLQSAQLYQSKDTHLLLYATWSNPKFYPYKLLLWFLKLTFIVNFGLSIEYYKSIKFSLESYQIVSTLHD